MLENFHLLLVIGMKELVLFGHVFFGVACLLASIWLFVDVLEARPGNLARIRLVSRAVAATMWLAFLVGGFWYVTHYAPDKAIILKGSWAFAHTYFMETKEHFVIPLLLLTTFLPMAAENDLAANQDARRLVLWLTALVVALSLLSEGHGAIISMGVREGLQKLTN